MNRFFIEKEVNKLIKKFQTRDPIKISKQKGIIVLYEDLGQIYGYYNKVNQIKFIHINKNLSFCNQVFTTIHELGHCVMHPNENTPKLSQQSLRSEIMIEAEANYFATRFIIDGSHLDHHLIDIYSIMDFYGLPHEMEYFAKMIIKNHFSH